MSETLNTEVAWLTQLPTRERTKVLAHVVHQLTVATRCLVLSEGTDTVRLERVRQLNEAQHRVAGYLLHAVNGDEETKWLRVVLGYLFGAVEEQVRRLCISVWTDVAQRYRPPT
jgi:hypothetical protein